MNLERAIEVVNIGCPNYEPSVGGSSTKVREDYVQDISMLIASLPSKGQKSFAWYILTRDEKDLGNCIMSLFSELNIQKRSITLAKFKIVNGEVNAVMSGTGSGNNSDLALSSHNLLALWKSDFLYRLKFLK